MRSMNDVNKYLEILIEFAERKLKPSFNIDKLNLQKFELVNSYLINQTIKDKKQKKSTLIYIPNKQTKSQFYLPAIFTLALYNFTDNFIDNITDFKTGKTVQKNGQRYKIYKTIANKYCLTKEDSSKLQITLSRNGIENYLITTDNKISNRQLKTKLDLYKSFFSSMIKENISFFPSEFKYKSVIVTDKSIVDELKKYEVDGEKIHKAIPFQYVTKSGTKTDNIPIDPMIYIVNDYETARKQILNKGIEIRNITFIGQNKYKDNYLAIAEDLRDYRYENCLMIGSADIPENSILNLLKWKWTLPELDYFNYFETQQIEKLIVDNEGFSKLLNEFDCLIKRIEDENYGINLQEIYRFIRNILPIIIPSQKSRITIQLDRALEYFEKEGEDIVETAFDEIGEYDYEDVWNEILKAFTSLINCKKISDVKFTKLQEFERIDYLIVSKEFLNDWKDEVENRKIRNVISFKDYKELNKEKQNKNIVFLGFFGYKHLELMMYSPNKINIILYPQEEQYFDNCFNRFKKENYNHISQADRKEISEISFKETEQIENISELIKRLFEQDEETTTDPDHLNQFVSNYTRELTFEEDYEKLPLDDNKTVLLKINNSERFEKVKNLMIGDKIRVYDNSSKEELYQVALEFDDDGEFSRIESYSNLWKKELQTYNKKFSSLNDLHKRLLDNGLSIKNQMTLNNWINPNSNVKFPKRNKDLIVLKRTLNSEVLNQNIKDIIKCSRNYNGLMNSLGRKFSSEIFDYCMNKNKGEMVKRFSDKQIQQFVMQNLKIRTIKTIKAIDNEQ